MEQGREHNATESAAQIQSGVIMKVSETEDGKISQFRSLQVDPECSCDKNDCSANEVLKYAVIQFNLVHQDTLHYHVL
jgi:hypothetical protein